MTYSIFEGEPRILQINPDCQGPAQKARAVWVAELFTEGSSTPDALDPKIDKPVTKELLPNTDLNTLHKFMELSGVELI